MRSQRMDRSGHWQQGSPARAISALFRLQQAAAIDRVLVAEPDGSAVRRWAARATRDQRSLRGRASDPYQGGPAPGQAGTGWPARRLSATGLRLLSVVIQALAWGQAAGPISQTRALRAAPENHGGLSCLARAGAGPLAVPTARSRNDPFRWGTGSPLL